MAEGLPGSVLFCCDHNAVRSPMAEGMMKKFYGHRAYVQSAGVKSEMEIDGFTVAVCAEMGIPLERHRVRSFEEMQEWGDDLSQFDLIVALSPASQRQALGPRDRGQPLAQHGQRVIDRGPVHPCGQGEAIVL